MALIQATDSFPIALDINQALINPKEVDEELKKCRKKKARLAVIEVSFADGSDWKAKK